MQINGKEMTPEEFRAMKDSDQILACVPRWEAAANNEDGPGSPDGYCVLCRTSEMECKGCPILDFTGVKNCCSTPWVRWNRLSHYTKAKRETAQEMADWLKETAKKLQSEGK